MPAVSMTITDLQSRGNDVREMLIPISAEQESGPAWQPKVGSYVYVIGTHDGSPPGSDYTDWTFATVRSDMRAQYYERWLKYEDKGRERWYLERAYLHIYKKDRETRDLDQILCLHCDPNDAPDEKEKETNPEKYQRLTKQSYYKRHPHLHVIAAEAPFPHAHLALHVGYVERLLASVSELTEAFRHAVQMIRDEVIDAPDA